MAFRASRGSRRRAVHQHATLPLRPWLAAIALGLALMGLAAKALIPDLVYDDLAYLASADPGNATTDDGDDGSKPAPGDGATASKFGSFEKALHVTIDLALPHSLMLIHGLAVPDAASEPLLPGHFLPDAETGPPAGLAHGSTTSLSHPQQQPPIVNVEYGTTPRSFPRRFSL